ncbi:tetratricopeptide repeat protein [Paenibacillus sp. 11B]|uniref:tetratricopeptide repeat protein n=1 Tax=Paenibacillus sp. 11B TaxID=3060965 RepID=UPI002653F63D|nr:tetratricopeptide repeat protein [Paenibacillus sp. 11B]MDN8588842.1 tetratricopeptide repeat protein [Paenibacillus sp. 11B]
MTFFEQGEELYEEGNYNEALVYFKKALNENIDIQDTMNYMGRCLTELKEYNAAIEVYDRAIRLFPTWERLYFNKGYVYLQLGNTEDALIFCKRAVMINSKSEDALYYLALCYQKKEEYKKAIEYYQKSLALNTNQEEAHINLGLIFHELGNNQEALDEFQWALQIDPSSTNAMYNKALVLKHMEKKEEAIIDFKKILISEPEDYDVRLQIAKIYLEENQFELTAYYLDSILSFDSNNTVALYFKGKLLERQGNYETSIKLLEHASSLDPIDIDILLLLAQLYSLIHLKEKERACYIRILKTDPENIIAKNKLR